MDVLNIAVPLGVGGAPTRLVAWLLRLDDVIVLLDVGDDGADLLEVGSFASFLIEGDEYFDCGACGGWRERV